MINWKFLPALMAMGLLTHCGSTPSAPKNRSNASGTTSKTAPVPKKATREVVQVGCTHSLTIQKGQVLILKLPSIAGTGYLWLLKQPAQLLKQQDANTLNYERMEKAEKLKVGFPQAQILTLEALELGQETLEWTYIRPTDPTQEENKCIIQITIQE
jgi:predicted secreted protein